MTAEQAVLGGGCFWCLEAAYRQVAGVTEVEPGYAGGSWPNPAVTEIKPLETFWLAEPEHRDYFRRYPERAYCQIIINPKLAKLKQQFAKRLRPAL